MKLIQVAAAALNQTPLDWAGNARNIRDAIAASREQGATIVCLPELSITGYGCADAFFSADVQQRALDVLNELLPETRGLFVTLGLPLMHGGAVFNCAATVADGELLGFVAKTHLAGDGVHYEPRWFKPWPAGKVGDVRIGGRTFPIGGLVFDCGGVRIGFEICEDAWAARRPGGGLSDAAVDLILNPSASHFAFGKQDVRRRLVLESSRAFGVSYVYANLLGNEAGRIIYDGSTLIAAGGKLLAEGPRLSFHDYTITTAIIDVDLTRMSRAQLASFQPAASDDGRRCVEAAFTFPEIEPRQKACAVPAWETGPAVKHEEYSRAVALGLFDYLRKSQSRGFVVSLSGGADSSAVATLVWLAVQFAVREMGMAALITKLSHIGDLNDSADTTAVVHRLLLCVYQATRNSSEATESAAADVAGGLGAAYLRLDVDPLVESYVGIISQALGRELNWKDDDVALQNIQARVRAPSVWMLANLRNALLLATSNRSEAAVGYATMDGDTCGGLSPIAGIDKAFLREWLDWMFIAGPEGIGPLAALERVNQLTPTAELRPPEAEQTDEDDLMPYDLLDWIERAAIRDKRGPLEVYRLARVAFSQYSPAQLVTWIERFFRLWSRNQWKRERYAPSFHLDDENLDPKTWCRFPILSGEFEQELTEMRAYAETDMSVANR